MDASCFYFLVPLGAATILFFGTVLILGTQNGRLKAKLAELIDAHKYCDRDYEAATKNAWEATEALAILKAERDIEVANLTHTIRTEATLIGKLQGTLALEQKRMTELWTEKCELQRDKDALLVVLRSMAARRKN